MDDNNLYVNLITDEIPSDSPGGGAIYSIAACRVRRIEVRWGVVTVDYRINDDGCQILFAFEPFRL